MSRRRAPALLAAVVGAGLLTAAATTTGAGAADPPAPWFPRFRTSAPAEPAQLRLATELPDVPGELPVLATSAAEVDVAALAERLGIGGRPFVDGDTIVVEGPADPATGHHDVLTVFPASGAVDYLRAGRFSPPAAPPALPAPDEAAKAAAELLRDLGLDGPTAGRDGPVFARAVLAEHSAKEGRTVQEITTELEVRFPLAVEGVPLDGPGAKAYVAFGDGGDVVGLTHVARELRPTGEELEVVRPDEALDLLGKGVGAVGLPLDCRSAEVVDMDLVYWAEPPQVEQRISLPAYRLELACTDGEDRGPFPAYAVAVADTRDLAERPPRPDVTPDDRAKAPASGPEIAGDDERR